MKILGIDYGSKRVGLAISDETLTLARELEIISPKEFFTKLPSLVKEEEISTIVLGLPLAMSGEDSMQTQNIREVKESIEKIVSVPVEFVDERLTSKWASEAPGGDKNIDSLAAQLILQNYLDKNKNVRI